MRQLTKQEKYTKMIEVKILNQNHIERGQQMYQSFGCVCPQSTFCGTEMVAAGSWG